MSKLAERLRAVVDVCGELPAKAGNEAIEALDACEWALRNIAYHKGVIGSAARKIAREALTKLGADQ